MSFLGTSIRRLTHPITIAFTLLIVVGVALSTLVGAQRTDHEIVQHTMEVKEALSTTQIAVYEAETGMRGFLITGRDDYLQPYIEAKDLLPLHIGNIQKLTNDNPKQQAAVARLKTVVDELLVTLERRINAMRTQGQAVALAAITGRSKALADEANGILRGMIAEEGRLLLERQATAERSAALVQILAITTLVFALVFGTLNAVEGSRRRKEIEAGHAALHESHCTASAPMGPNWGGELRRVLVSSQ